MAAYLAARLRVKNPDALASYSKRAATIVGKFGGKLLFKGGADDILIGAIDLPNLAVFEFPDQDAITAFYNSDAYQALAAIREEGADMVLSSHAGA